MRFVLIKMRRTGRAAIAALAVTFAAPVSADMGYAVVPTSIIYPGDAIAAGQVEEVQVTNPNLAGDYARTVSEVVGMVSKRTLLPGRTITVSALRVPYAVKRGSTVRIGFQMGSMHISASGTPMQDASVGDLIKVRNLDSGLIVSGTVMADGTVQVMAQ